MAVLNYKDLNLSKETLIKKFKWNGHDIEVLGYLPVEDKYDIVMITLQRSFENGIYNPIKLDMYYHLNLVYAYSNLVFSDEDRADESKLFDELTSSGFMEEFLKNLNPTVYAEMLEDIENIAKLNMQYNAGVSGIIDKVMNDLPLKAEELKEIIDNFDPEKYQAVIDFAKAANGGRPIS
jgi:hypothetical protein